MARPEERMRLKDKIVDNISKAIKSIQSHHFYKAPGADDRRTDAGFTLGNVDKPCHKLCENLDHAFLHGLKNVSHGYWPVVKQLSHKGMIKEIEMLINVTTDLGRGRAWLYASLNEGLLESYIRLLDENEKLVKKYYAKEALLLDHDRLNLLLTLITGLECVIFQLDFDQPYLDLNAYPPRSRADSDLEESAGSSPLSSEKNRPVSEVSLLSCASGPPAHTAPSDSDSSSLASVDVHPSNHQAGSLTGTGPSAMRVSTVSSDSGCPTGDAGGGGQGRDAQTPLSPCFSSLHGDAERRSVTPTERSGPRQRASQALDAVSITSVGSSGDPDRIQRVEHILPQREGGDDDADGTSLEVIRVKSKRNSGNTRIKKKKKERHSDGDAVLTRDQAETRISQSSEPGTPGPGLTRVSVAENSTTEADHCARVHQTSGVRGDAVQISSEALASVAKSDRPESKGNTVDSHTSKPQCNTGIDIHSMLVSENFSADKGCRSSSDGVLGKSYDNSKSAFAQIENKIAELCFVPEENQSPNKKHGASTNIYGLSQSSDITSQELLFSSKKRNLPHDHHHHHHPHQNSNKSAHAGKSHDQPQPAHKAPDSSHRADLDSKSSSTRSKDVKDGVVTPKHASQTADPKSTLTPSGSNDRHDPTGSETEDRLSRAKTDRSVRNMDAVDDFDFYACDNSEADQGETTGSSNRVKVTAATAQITSAHAASQLDDYMDFILQGAESPPESQSTLALQEVDTPVDLAVDLDNNTKLQIMLDIFTHEHEKFIKMFATRESHTEGEAAPVFVVISDHCLYLLHYKRTWKKFTLSSCANLVDLIFVSTGLNDQTLNLESREKSRQKQRLWLTPGHQSLTQAILSCLTDAVKAANEQIVAVRPRFSVGSEVPLQKIALRKYISKELNTEAQDVAVNDYSLVFWEDPSSDADKRNDAACKEGTLLLRS
ncbi:hypothetical protein EGW08_003533 [Elysia chlorotica]|uniref:RUN domain-containing protein n=1 Tax=Elysia chlorotica TaxID=188477 RepID=A0A433U4K4_ELYCH|nr:hypothetical protein EGW08_003533 [Elysia chlorotica]